MSTVYVSRSPGPKSAVALRDLQAFASTHFLSLEDAAKHKATEARLQGAVIAANDAANKARWQALDRTLSQQERTVARIQCTAAERAADVARASLRRFEDDWRQRRGLALLPRLSRS